MGAAGGSKFLVASSRDPMGRGRPLLWRGSALGEAGAGHHWCLPAAWGQSNGAQEGRGGGEAWGHPPALSQISGLMGPLRRRGLPGPESQGQRLGEPQLPS